MDMVGIQNQLPRYFFSHLVFDFHIENRAYLAYRFAFSATMLLSGSQRSASVPGKLKEVVRALLGN
jgi:hypothetical protein